MAYVIPVAALIVDEQAAASILSEPSNFFENPNNDRFAGLEDLTRITGAPIQSFTDESQDIYYIGLYIEDDWRIDIDATLLSKAAALKAQYPHALVQSAQLAVVSQFN